MQKPENKKTDRFTPEQIEELAGDYKHTDNPTSEDFSEEMTDAVKRKNSPKNRNDQ